VQTTLGETIKKVRFETGQTARISQGGNDREHVVHLINRVQMQLATQFDWPRRHESVTVALSAGEHTYDIPDPLTFEGIERVVVDYVDTAVVMSYGVHAEHTEYLNFTDPEDRRYPPRRWEYVNGGGGFDRLRVWPVPDRAGTLTLEGSGQLMPLENDDDVLAFNADMVALYVASELLAAQGDELASAKSGMAESLRRAEMHRQQSKKSGHFMMGRMGENERPPRYGIDYVE
jgi:hypothetical protein